MNNLINQELKLYQKILSINIEINKLLNENEINIEEIDSLIKERDEKINEIKELELKLEVVWNNWEKYKNLIDKNKVIELRQILSENLKLEEKIVGLFKNQLEKVKFKLKDYDKGKKALHGYRQAKVNIPMFKSFKI